MQTGRQEKLRSSVHINQYTITQPRHEVTVNMQETPSQSQSRGEDEQNDQEHNST